MINAVYDSYFQKSWIFLYPLLGIKKGVSVTPIQTYISWEGLIEPEDGKLVCLYYLRDDAEYRTFEQTRLLKHELFDDFKEVEPDTSTNVVRKRAVYVFDLNKYREDYESFLKGKYSKVSPYLKSRIKDYIRTNSPEYVYVESFLYPQKFFNIYARLLNAPEDVARGETLLKQVGELCDKPDLSSETLKLGVKDLQITGELS